LPAAKEKDGRPGEMKYNEPILMAILFIAAVAVPVAVMMVLVPGLWPRIIRGFESILRIMREPPFPVPYFNVHYFLRDGVGHALLSRVVKT